LLLTDCFVTPDTELQSLLPNIKLVRIYDVCV